jgi:hypothetical protein
LSVLSEDTVPIIVLPLYSLLCQLFAKDGQHARKVLALVTDHADILDLTGVQATLQAGDFFAQLGGLTGEFSS